MATEDNNELRLTRSPTRHAFAWETIVSTVLTVKSSFHCFFKLAAAVRTLVFSKKRFEHCLVFNASGSLALAMRYFSPVSEPVQDQLFFFWYWKGEDCPGPGMTLVWIHLVWLTFHLSIVILDRTFTQSSSGSDVMSCHVRNKVFKFDVMFKEYLSRPRRSKRKTFW